MILVTLELVKAAADSPRITSSYYITLSPAATNPRVRLNQTAKHFPRKNNQSTPPSKLSKKPWPVRASRSLMRRRLSGSASSPSLSATDRPPASLLAGSPSRSELRPTPTNSSSPLCVLSYLISSSSLYIHIDFVVDFIAG